MKFKLHRPRSCLGWFGWVAGILIAFVLFSNVYAQVRLYIARTQAEALSREFGYTSNDLLFFRKDISNVNIISGSAKCDADIYFVTPLELDEFEAKLMQAIPEAWRLNMVIEAGNRVYEDLSLNAFEANGNKVEDKYSLPPVVMTTWDLRRADTTTVTQYQTQQLSMSLKYGERPIADNIAVVSWGAGRYPIWVACI